MAPIGRVRRSHRGMLDQFWLWSMQAGLKNSYDSIKAFSETDFTEDLKKFDVPTLVMHGEDDQVVPIKDSAKKSAKLVKGAREIYYPGRPHGLTATHQDEVNADLLKFLKSVQEVQAKGEFTTFTKLILALAYLMSGKRMPQEILTDRLALWELIANSRVTLGLYRNCSAEMV